MLARVIDFTPEQIGTLEAFIEATDQPVGPVPTILTGDGELVVHAGLVDPEDMPAPWPEPTEAEMAAWPVPWGTEAERAAWPTEAESVAIRKRLARWGIVIEDEEDGTMPDRGENVVNFDAARDNATRAQQGDGSYVRPFPGKNLASFTAALNSLGLEFRYNSRSQGTEYLEDGEWLKLTDRYEDSTQEAVAARFWVKVERGARPLYFGRESWSRCLNAYMHTRSVDPFELYLESLPAWDKRLRLDFYLRELFGTADGELETWVSRFLFVGAVQRTYEPACEMREMPVLIGDQGIGKSAVTRLILPQHIPGLHSDRLRWDSYAGQQVDAVRGKVVVEVSEMAGRSRAQMGLIKSFISCIDDDGVRLAYRKNPDPMPRRFILIGTTNQHDDLPNDATGLTRFVPVICEHGSDVGAYMAEHRIQLWAEALHRYRGGLRANMPRHLMAEQAERAEEHRNRDEYIEDAIVSRLGTIPMTAGQVRTELGEGFKDYSAQRIGNALSNAGWTRRKRGPKGKRQLMWVPPQARDEA